MKKSNKKLVKIELLHELLKDSSRSDRELSKVIGVSQPTVSKMKKTLLDQGVIQGFTMIPNFSEMGYTILALTLVKMKPLFSSEEYKNGHEKSKKWVNEESNIIFADYCRGMDMDALMISFHKSYQYFDKFIKRHNQKFGYLLHDVQNILINLVGDDCLKPFHFKYLAENLKEKS